MRSASVWFSTLLIGSAALLLGCEAVGPTAPGITVAPLEASMSTPAKPPIPPNGGLLTCRPLAYDSVTQVIGPLGGLLVVSRHVLWVPAGALPGWVSITAVAPSDTVNRIRFGPEGLVFKRPVALIMSYANCNLRASPEAKRVAYTNDSLEILQYQPSADDVLRHKVTGLLGHFSTYAVSW